MLHLVGLGLDDGEITEKGLEALENSEKIYAEFYTNTETVDIEALENRLGIEIEQLERSEVEQEDKILESAGKQDTAFLVSGDPLTATTHYDIKHRAEQEGIEIQVVHAPSILTSVNETGLNLYKFGRVVTLPREGRPESIVEHIENNDAIDLHTLVLLDINYEADAAAEKLLDMGIGNRETVVVERANHSSQQIKVEKLEQVAETSHGETPHSLILTGEKSHMEKDFLKDHR